MKVGIVLLYGMVSENRPELSYKNLSFQGIAYTRPYDDFVDRPFSTLIEVEAVYDKKLDQKGAAI